IPPPTTAIRRLLALTSHPSARRLRATGLREHDLPELPRARAEAAGEAEEIELPHALERVVVAPAQRRPRRAEALMPREEGPLVVGSEVVPILHHEQVLERRAELRDGREHSVREDVLLDPRVTMEGRAVVTDRVQQEEPVVFERAVHDLHVA